MLSHREGFLIRYGLVITQLRDVINNDTTGVEGKRWLSMELSQQERGETQM